MKKILLVTVVSFVLVGVLIFVGLNVMTWAVKEIEQNQRPNHSRIQPAQPSQPQPGQKAN